MSLSNAANRIARQMEVSLDLPAGSESNPPFATNGDTPSQRLQGIVPRRSQRNIRHATSGSLSSISSGGGAISVESSIDAFAKDLLSLATQALETSVPRSTSPTTARNIDVAGLAPEVSNLTIDQDISTTNTLDEEHPLIIERVQSRLVAKHIQSGRLTAISSSIDLRDGRSREHLADAAGGQRRVRTTLSFGSNLAQDAYQSPRPSSIPRAMRRNDSWQLEHDSSEERITTAANNRLTNQAAVSAGRALLRQ